MVSAITRNNVRINGQGTKAMVFAHGFGCDQNMWRFVAPAFETDFRVVLFDNVGAGGSDRKAYDLAKYASLTGYAADLVEIGQELGLKDAIFVGHSVSAMTGLLAAHMAPDLFGRLVLVAPSPCYVNDGEYVGGFETAQIDELLEFLGQNLMGWSSAMGPTIMGNAERPELSEELTASFCRMDPAIANDFARVTFKSDHRSDLAKVSVPTLILQCSNDSIAPRQVGEYMHSAIKSSDLIMLDATGHCPNLSAPKEVIKAIHAFVH